ncbi:hypothetical protein PIB30_090247, partial [Stylosanthes scabra]|nr:hypothetical protein [Stylosanthes scabra]
EIMKKHRKLESSYREPKLSHGNIKVTFGPCQRHGPNVTHSKGPRRCQAPMIKHQVTFGLPFLSKGNSPKLPLKCTRSHLAKLTHLAKRDTHGLKASLGKLSNLKNKSRLAHVS